MIPRAKVVYTFLATLCCVTMLAVPAKRGQWKTITLSDGRQVKVELRGDERSHWWEDSIGNRYVLCGMWNEECGMRNDTETRGTRNEEGGTRYDNEIWEKIEKKDWSRKHNTRRYWLSPSAPTVGSHSTFHIPHSTKFVPPSSKTSSKTSSNNLPSTSYRRGLIILVEFQNKQFKEENDRVLFERIANEQGFSERGFKGSVSDYFRDQSGGLFNLTFDVVGPVMVSQDYEYYGTNVPPDNYDEHPDEMIVEACKLVDDEVDFADYDWNGDGYVEQVVVIYAGMGEADGGGKNSIWPHEWDLVETGYGKTLRLDKVRINTYACSPELSSRSRIAGIGTLCHEFSHCLGLPDFYDSKGGNYGMGYWDIMDYGSYNGDGFRPAGFTAYEKMFCGWQQPITLSTDTVVTDMKALSEGGDAYIIYNDAHHSEFYTLENRQKSGWDKDLPGTGLIITHVDYDPFVWFWNVVNSYDIYYDVYDRECTNDHEHCSVVQADNNKSRLQRALAGDAYPYQLRDSLTAYSRPATTLYHEDLMGNKLLQVAIMHITRNTDTTMSFEFIQRGTQASGIRQVRKENTSQTAIYSLQGVYLGSDPRLLPQGIYLINGKKIYVTSPPSYRP